tara:strand:+ start:1062 stop:1301 length:240 start_codon:yes stop_codon:yes gene_type:complete
MNTYEDNKELTLADSISSYWLKNAVKALDKRDALDALNDAEALFDLAKQRLNQGPSYDHQEHRAEMGHGFIGKDGGPVN